MVAPWVAPDRKDKKWGKEITAASVIWIAELSEERALVIGERNRRDQKNKSRGER